MGRPARGEMTAAAQESLPREGKSTGGVPGGGVLEHRQGLARAAGVRPARLLGVWGRGLGPAGETPGLASGQHSTRAFQTKQRPLNKGTSGKSPAENDPLGTRPGLEASVGRRGAWGAGRAGQSPELRQGCWAFRAQPRVGCGVSG